MKELEVIRKELYNARNTNEFVKTLGSNQAAQAFLVELWSAVANEKSKLYKCDKTTIISGALQVARLGLSFSSSLGQAALVPYGDSAQLQIMYKGMIQLALRTGKFRKMAVVEIYRSEFKRWNKIEEELELGERKKEDNEIVGYYAFFETVDGFRKADYWTRERIQEHAEKFSKTVNSKDGVWAKHFDAMAKKTVLKALIRTYGLVDMSLVHAVQADQAVISGSEYKYVDNPMRGETINIEESTKEGKLLSAEELAE